MKTSRRPWLSLRRDQRGVSAIEFALIAPVAIAFYMGAAEFCQGFMAQKRMGHVASQVADMVAQEETITTVEIDNLFDIGGLIMKPFPTTDLQMRVSSVTRGSDGVVKVDWSRGDGMAARAVGSTVTVPNNMISNGESLVMSEAIYNYDSPVDYLMPAVTQFTHSYYLRPRMVPQVACSNC
ncbi:MAG: pilus assembly protein [Brevundimonas sp.]|nr:MAG: pilus assembly protein [Brevundimonas sp.]